MQTIKKCSIDNIIDEDAVIIGAPSDALLQLQNDGYLVLCELAHLQGKSEMEIEEALQKEEAVWQYQHICIDVNALPEEYFARIWYRHKGKPVVIGETKRLLIRESIPEDAECFFALYQDAEVRKYVELPELEKTFGESYKRQDKIEAYATYITQYAENQYAFFEYGMWSVIEKESGVVIGRAGLEMQAIDGKDNMTDEKLALGYALLPAYRGRGYAYEACEKILDYCIKCGYAKEVYVKIDPKNAKSNNLYTKLHKNNEIILKKL